MSTPNPQQSPYPPNYPAYPQRKSNKLLWIVLGIVIGVPTLLMGGCVALMMLAGLSNPAEQGKTQPVSQADEQPLSPEQKRWIANVLKETDKLDTIYKRRTRNANQYVEAGKKAEQEYFSGQDLLPEKDTRRILLTNTMKAYQDVGVLLLANETGQAKESPDALMAAAGMRKVLLRKVVDGKLNAQEKELIDTLRKEWSK